MLRFLICGLLLLPATRVDGQAVISASDMPVPGDSLRFSTANPLTNAATYAASGPNYVWDFSLTPVAQGLDYYKRPGEVNPLLAFTIGNLDCYGYRIADSIPGISLLAQGIAINDVYNYFNMQGNPETYQAEAFSADISGFPVGAKYTIPDVLYSLPMTYGKYFTNDFYLRFGAPGVGSITQSGYRATEVDGWGTIRTPYYTSPVSCIRVRSEIVEIDSIMFNDISFGLPRTTIEYKWLVPGERFPALQVTVLSIAGFEVPAQVKYKDIYRPEFDTIVRNITKDQKDIFAYPNPAVDGWIRFELPDSWTTNYQIEFFDTRGRSVLFADNKRQLSLMNLARGYYIARVTSGKSTAYVKVVR